jgi:iron complex outermembrane receptor protein
MTARWTLCLLIGSLSMVALAPGARADDVPLVEIDTSALNKSLEEVVVIAAKRPQPIREAAASTSVITAADLEAYGWRNWQEAVASLAGFYTTYTGEFTYFGVRGLNQSGDSNTHILMLVDGHTQNELWSNSTYPEGMGLDAAMIDHIEVLRGPASALYGSLGFAAIINIVTKRGTENEWARATVDVSAENLRSMSGGAGLGFRGVLTIGHQFKNGLEFGVDASAFGALGNSYTYPDAIVTNPDGTKTDQLCVQAIPSTCTNGVSNHATDGATGVAVYGHLNFKGFSLKASYQYWDKKIPFGPYQSLFNDTANHYLITRGYVDLGYEVGKPSTVQVQARAYFDSAGYLDDLAYYNDGSDGNPTGRYIFHDEAHPWWTGAEVKGLLEREWKNRLSLAITGGGEFTYFHGDDQSGPVVSAVMPMAVPVTISKDLIFGAAYVQAEAAYARKVLLTLGVRGDFSQIFPSAVSPRAGLVLLPHETVTFKLLYAHGFLRPSWYQAFFRDGMSILDNAQLSPEQVDNYEVVYQQKIGRALTFTGSLFYIHGSDLIDTRTVCVDQTTGATNNLMGDQVCPAGKYTETQRQNTSSFQSEGAEAGLVGRFTQGTRFYLNYSWTHATGDDGTVAFNAPAHLLKGGVAVNAWREHLIVGADASFFTSRRVTIAGTDTTDPYVVVGAHILWRDLPKNFSAMLRVTDLVGTTWFEPSTAEQSAPIFRIPHQGPSLQLRLSYAY